jgi:hypothetical protein
MCAYIEESQTYATRPCAVMQRDLLDLKEDVMTEIADVTHVK